MRVAGVGKIMPKKTDEFVGGWSDACQCPECVRISAGVIGRDLGAGGEVVSFRKPAAAGPTEAVATLAEAVLTGARAC